MNETSIEWVGKRGKSWNILKGCSLKSEGCRNCYAMRQARRFSGPGQPYEGLTVLTSTGPKWAGKIEFARHKLEEPLKLKAPRKIFVNSMSDLFHEDVPDEWLDEIFAVMALCPQHIFIVLTKRPARMLEYMAKDDRKYDIDEAAEEFGACHGNLEAEGRWPMPNVWLGVSVENQQTANERIPLLMRTPAAIRLISCEPLLGEVDIRRWLPCPRGGPNTCPNILETCSQCDSMRTSNRATDWVIVGGESGPDARPMHPYWVRSLLDQCTRTGQPTPFFFKQWGAWAPSFHDSLLCNPLSSKFTALRVDGREYDPAVQTEHVSDAVNMYRIGKKHAGRLLDGQEWNEFPQSIADKHKLTIGV